MLSKAKLKQAFTLMAQAKAMTELYEENFQVVSKYVHATSRGHEAIQIAVGMQLLTPRFRSSLLQRRLDATIYRNASF